MVVAIATAYIFILLFTTDQCTLQPVTGPCRARIPSFFYNTTSGNCERFIYGGCGGNGNRFKTATECTAHCSSNGKILIYCIAIADIS